MCVFVTMFLLLLMIAPYSHNDTTGTKLNHKRTIQLDAIAEAVRPALLQLFYYDVLGFDSTSTTIGSCDDLIDTLERLNNDLQTVEARSDSLQVTSATNPASNITACLSTSIVVSDLSCDNANLCDSVFNIPYCTTAQGIVECERGGGFPEVLHFGQLAGITVASATTHKSPLTTAVATNGSHVESLTAFEETKVTVRAVCERNLELLQETLDGLEALAIATDVTRPAVHFALP
mgnify:CR=1 FL=1